MSAFKARPIYNAVGWVLGECVECGRYNYVEPHGTTARCACELHETEHDPIPYDCRDMGGLTMIRPTRRNA